MTQTNDRPWRVIFTPECQNDLERFGTLEELDEALSPVKRNLEKNPYTFPEIPNAPEWIMIKTRRHLCRSANKIIPGLRLVAEIKHNKRQVIIKGAEINPDDRIIYM